MAFTLTSSGAAVVKAGTNRSTVWSVGDSGQTGQAILDKWSNQAEGKIVAETRRDWVGKYSTLGDGVKNILDDVCSSIIAKQIISFDMSGFTSRAEAFTMLNVQDDIVGRGIAILKDFKSNDIKDP